MVFLRPGHTWSLFFQTSFILLQQCLLHYSLIVIHVVLVSVL